MSLHPQSPSSTATSIAGPAVPAGPSSDGLYGSVTLDKAWARRLGVQRTAGKYLISRVELRRRLQAIDAAPAMPVEWEIDSSHSNVGFIARHLVLAKVRGAFREFNGTIKVGGGAEDCRVEVTVKAASIDTGLSVRDEHLRSADFLDVFKHPYLRFKSTRLERVEGNRFKLAGDLTIRGITQTVVMDLDFLGTATDPSGQLKAAFEARTQINREDFGLTWNRALEAGGVLLDKVVTLEIEAQAVPKVPAA